MAATRSTRKLARQWVRQTRRYVLKFLHASRFPAIDRHGQRGKPCASPEGLLMLLGALAVKCTEPTSLGMHRRAGRFWNA